MRKLLFALMLWPALAWPQNFTIDSLTDKATPDGTDEFIIDEGSGAYRSLTATNLQSYAQTGINSTTVLHKSADYTVTTSDLNAIVFVDASAASRDITLPTVANLSGKTVKVVLDADPGTNDVEVYESDGATEIWTGVEKGDWFEVSSDGTNYKVIGHYEGYYIRVYVSADEAVAQGASEKIVTLAEDTDTGGAWNTSTDELDIPFDAMIDLHWHVMAVDGNGHFAAEAKLDATDLRDAANLVTAGGKDVMAMPTLSGRFAATSGQKLELWARNLDNDGGNQSIAGDAAGDESFATITLERIY